MDGKRLTAADGSWLAEWPSRLTPLVDLLCFPGAGAGGSAFRPWVGLLPGFTAMLAARLPGREERIDEAPATELGEAAAQVVAAYAAARPARRPLVLYGHSMGAVLAFEAARRLIDLGRAPSALLMSASTPPTGGGGGMDTQALKQLLLAYDPENRAIVSSDELFATLAPTLRADIALLRRHRITGPPLAPAVWGCLLGGATDPVVPPPDVALWDRHFAAPAEHATLPGGHHFPFRESQDAVLQRIARALRRAIGGESHA